MKNSDADEKDALLVIEREKVTKLLLFESLNFRHYLHRATIHHDLGYSDLAAGDAYRALTLLESYFCPEFSDFYPQIRGEEGENEPWPDDEQTRLDAKRDMVECLRCLVLALTDLGCFRDAHSYLLQLEKLDNAQEVHAEKQYRALCESLLRAQEPNGDVSEQKVEPSRLRNFGSARRDTYIWNCHEPDRSSPDMLVSLNALLKPVAPYLEAQCVELPVLDRSDRVRSHTKARDLGMESSYRDRPAKSLQLGLFAKVDLQPGQSILNENSVLTAVRPLDASLCYNCGASISEPLTASSSPDDSISCSCCGDAAVFCSQACLDIAQTNYHSTTCGNEDIDLLGRGEDSDTPSEDLYFLLLVRTFAISHARDIHPLELPETRYLWGEFLQEHQIGQNTPRTLPFTFQHNIVLPFRLLSILSEEHPEMSPFSARGLDWYDTWVVETLYAKFRGVASARQSTWDGKPEVAAVHPLWCLANHSCAPNVEWGWERQRVFRVREDPIDWGGIPKNEWKGIKAGKEILSHYCDIDLSVKERREYMLGPLGGTCMCPRCIWEAGEE